MMMMMKNNGHPKRAIAGSNYHFHYKVILLTILSMFNVLIETDIQLFDYTAQMHLEIERVLTSLSLNKSLSHYTGVVNLSDHVLNKDEQSLLSKNLKFCPTPAQ